MPPSNYFKPPKFRKRDDPVTWLIQFEKAAKLNDWNDDARLYIASSALVGRTQDWMLSREFETWESFKEAFIAKYHKKVSHEKLVKKIIDFKTKRGETVRHYIDRYEALCTDYQRGNNQDVQRCVSLATTEGEEGTAK
ncbi:hypothetical protein G6F37_013174 [Rhizopus arrhizus]|nr:hypothetical protein G6F38_013426 [Rhizopus arrhizus]KAG1139344.1 hypothetical protein G6F37_013174 [Rhizopus arrhizus]